MNQRQHQSDRNRREAGWNARVGRSHDHEQEHQGHHDLAHERRGETVTARRVCAVAVGREAARQAEAGRTAGDNVEHGGGENSAEHLRDHVGREFAARKTSARPQSETHCGIDVASGDVPDSVGHRQQREPEGERHSGEADS